MNTSTTSMKKVILYYILLHKAVNLQESSYVVSLILS